MLSQSSATRRRSSAPKTTTAENSADLKIGNRRVTVSRLDKIFYPKTGFTKGQVIDYYIRISPVMLPHLRGRPLTLKRYPDGVEGLFFYEKRCPDYRPDWMKTALIRSGKNQTEVNYCVANDLATIIWVANLGDLELHTNLAKAATIDRPTMVVFDLDPGAPANILDCARVALLIKERLDALKLQSFVKTSGSKGLHFYIPLNTAVTYDDTKPFARALAETMAREHPGLVVAKMAKDLRRGKVFIDWSQNDRHKTTVAAYSLRAKERPTVSTPITWDDLHKALRAKSATQLSFESEAVLKRVSTLGDLFAPVATLKQRLPHLEALQQDAL